ncbi:hypothetical protein [Bosea sp. (in: a-proteobacteria)]|uniref:hypothetical protein n=1 Tax=Bosea sp. (in: a-proteobacteria) TaxID=1871050 RepID=UPI002FCA20B6
MADHPQHSARLAPTGNLTRAAAFAIMAGSAFFSLGSGPASAQSSWEQGCATRMVSPGAGDALRVYNCSRQKECQQMANAKGAMMMEMGCFFVAPSAAPAPQAGRSRPAQQH